MPAKNIKPIAKVIDKTQTFELPQDSSSDHEQNVNGLRVSFGKRPTAQNVFNDTDEDRYTPVDRSDGYGDYGGEDGPARYTKP